MNELAIEIDSVDCDEPFVARLHADANGHSLANVDHDASFVYHEEGWGTYDHPKTTFRLKAVPADINGDVLWIVPGSKSARRLIRANSRHNTFLVTERCDQLCVMCSQPPKAKHFDMFVALEQAALLAPRGMTIGISGGEPTLYKDRLFALLETVIEDRPDLQFHVLTNGQHFASEDIPFLSSKRMANIVWAVPIYADTPALHDRIVGKEGAFGQLLESMLMLSHTLARLELRTVLLQSNVERLPFLADFLTEYVPFAEFWSIMQLERIGFGKMNWATEFFDSSIDFKNVGRALNIATGRGMNAYLYNFPYCSVPEPYREYAVNSISDWKQKYMAECENCHARSICTGFFRWYDERVGFKNLGPL